MSLQLVPLLYFQNVFYYANFRHPLPQPVGFARSNLLYFQNIFYYTPSQFYHIPPLPFPTAQVYGFRGLSMVTKNAPVVYNPTLGTTSIQILPANPTRFGLVFFNPGPNNVAICPAISSTGAQVAAVIFGAGSITLSGGSVLLMPPVAWEDAVATTAWNAIAAAAASPFTIWEF